MRRAYGGCAFVYRLGFLQSKRQVKNGQDLGEDLGQDLSQDLRQDLGLDLGKLLSGVTSYLTPLYRNKWTVTINPTFLVRKLSVRTIALKIPDFLKLL